MNHDTITNELNETTKLLINKVENMGAEISKKDAELSLKDKELTSKDIEINNLKNELAYLKGIIASDSKVNEPTLEEITYKRAKKNSVTGKKDNLANLERVVIEHKLEGEDLKCKKCGSDLVEIGIKSKKEILKYIAAKLIVEEHIMYSYACKSCESEAAKSNTLPLYRQESYFYMMGAALWRQTLCNWTMAAAKVLEPIYNYIKEDLLKRDYIHADETTLKVINDNGKDSKSKKYMWLYMSQTEDKPIILYDYQSTRSSSCPKNFLKNYKGYLQTDGYSGYNSVSEAKRIYCLAHIRRKFHEVIINLNEEALKESRALIGFNYCEQIYKLEKELRDTHSNNPDYYEIRYKERNNKLAPILDDFIEYIDKEILLALPRSPLGKALDYAKKHVPSLKTVLLDGRLEIDNNAAEREIKPFVLGRKNFLFANTSKGATASSYLYSIVETAKDNKLVIERYLAYLLDDLKIGK